MPSEKSNTPLAWGFPPVEPADSRVLVLGSLPGRTSIQMQQYYAQSRNSFWRIAGELFGAHRHLPYQERLARLANAGVALWDVLAAGERQGSLDAAIVSDSIVVNDFPAFFARHPAIRVVCFNGRKAEALYLRRVLPALTPELRQLELRGLPSTSPAHASRSFDQKLQAWSAALSEFVVPATEA